MKRILMLFSCLIFMTTYKSYSLDWFVATNGTGQGTNGWADATNNLQGAISACVSNYTVWVSNGIYVGSFTNYGGVTVRSESGIPTTVILDGNGMLAVTNLSSSVLFGLTISNGYNNGVMGGTIYNCIIRDCGADGFGGGASGCNIYNTIIYKNWSTWTAGGAYQCNLYNCTVVGNTENFNTGGGMSDCNAYNCISWGNNKVDVFPGGYTNLYSCGVQGAKAFYNTSVGCFTNNPKFINQSLVNFRLQPTSPCIGAGTNSYAVNPDLDGNQRIRYGRVDMGAYECIYSGTFCVFY